MLCTFFLPALLFYADRYAESLQHPLTASKFLRFTFFQKYGMSKMIILSKCFCLIRRHPLKNSPCQMIKSGFKKFCGSVQINRQL
jgi:hypothetical protein